MKLMIVVVLALVAYAAGAAIEVPEQAVVLKSEFQQAPEGGYVSSFETSNGIKSAETGEVKSVADEENKPHDVVVVRGEFSYPRPDGTVEQIVYFADETGFHADGPSVPKLA